MDAGTRLRAIGLIALMALGSIMLWLGIPLGWLVIASQLTDSTQPTMGPYLLVIVGIPVTMVVVGKGLAKLNHVYARVTDTEAKIDVREHVPWLRSMRGERAPARPRTVLDVVMVISVVLAGFVAAVWFFFFAGSSLPGSG